MAMTDIPIEHDSAGHRFTTSVEGTRAHLDYLRGNGVITITHTRVPDAIGGRGIAGALVQAAMEYARAERLKVNPACSYAASWMQRHLEYADLRA